MRFVMMNTDEWFSQREGNRLPGLESDEQRRGQTRALCRCNGRELSYGNPRIGQRRLRDWQKVAEMFARGEFGNDATVFGVHLDLR